MKKKAKDPNKVGFGGMMIWQSRMVSASIVTLLLMYLMIYCTDTLQIPASIVSIILVASKVLDGVTDMVAGYIVDRTQTRWGKARPYEVFIILLWLCTWLLFSCPESLSMTLKCVWIFVMYALVNSVCYTFLNANNVVYTARAYTEKQIVSLTSYGSIVTMLAGLIFNVTFPTVMGKFATSGAGWSRLVGVMAIPLAAIGILRMLLVEEKYDMDVGEKDKKLEVKDIAVVVKTNKNILLLAATNFMFAFVCNMGISTYYYKYIVKNIGLMGLASAASIIAIPMALFFPKLIEKFSVVKLMIAGFIVSAAGYLLFFFAGANVPVLMVASLLTGAGAVPASMLIGLVVLDCAEYNEWKGIHRMEGTMNNIVGLGNKVGSAVGTGALGALLSMSGYTGVAETMPDSAYIMIKLLMSLIPMVLYLLTACSLFTYKLDKDMPQIRKENEERRKAKWEVK